MLRGIRIRGEHITFTRDDLRSFLFEFMKKNSHARALDSGRYLVGQYLAANGYNVGYLMKGDVILKSADIKKYTCFKLLDWVVNFRNKVEQKIVENKRELTLLEIRDVLDNLF